MPFPRRFIHALALTVAIASAMSIGGCTASSTTSPKTSQSGAHNTQTTVTHTTVAKPVSGAPGWRSQALSIGIAAVTSGYDSEVWPGSVACATKSFCVAAGDTGYVWTWNGARWSSPTKAVEVSQSFEGSFAISCPTSRFCMLISKNEGAIFDGHTWSPVAVNLQGSGAYPSLSCASAELCLAENGSVSLWNGHEWVSQSENLLPNGSASVACATDGFCLAVDAGSTVVAYEGRSWVNVAGIPTANGVEQLFCASSVSCLGQDEAGGTRKFNGVAWNRVAPSPLFPALQMACGGIDFCVAISDVDVTVWNGSSWSSPMSLYQRQSLATLTGISCALNERRCMAILEVLRQGGVSGDLGLNYRSV